MKYIEEYLNHLNRTGYAEGTIRYHRSYLKEFKGYLKARFIYQDNQVRQKHIEWYMKYLHKKKLQICTKVSKLLTVKKYFHYLHKRKQILIDPFRKIDIPKQPHKLPKNILTEQEIIELLEKPDLNTNTGIRDRAILELLYSTGIRRQELVNLNMYDIDISRGILRINKGKNSKDRIVPVGRIACYYVTQYINKVRLNAKDKALFITEHGARLKTGTLAYIIKRYTESRASAHSIRHSFAVHMMKGGANLRAIQEMLGHKKLSTTEIYTKLSPIDLKEAHRKSHPRAIARN